MQRTFRFTHTCAYDGERVNDPQALGRSLAPLGTPPSVSLSLRSGRYNTGPFWILNRLNPAVSASNCYVTHMNATHLLYNTPDSEDAEPEETQHTIVIMSDMSLIHPAPRIIVGTSNSRQQLLHVHTRRYSTNRNQGFIHLEWRRHPRIPPALCKISGISSLAWKPLFYIVEVCTCSASSCKHSTYH